MCFPVIAIDALVSTYFAVSAPLVIRVLISSSWPYLAAMCKGVFPFLSSQSITAPAIKDMLSDTRLYIKIKTNILHKKQDKVLFKHMDGFN